MKYQKLDERTLGVTDDAGDTRVFTWEWLHRQRAAIQKHTQRSADMHAAELAEVDDLLAQCKTLGVTAWGRANVTAVPLQRLGVMYDDTVPEPPAPPTKARGLWAWLTKPRWIGQ